MLSRRGFLGALAGLLTIPAAAIAKLRRCEHDFDPMTKFCRRCGISVKQMWIDAAKNTRFVGHRMRKPEFVYYTNYAALTELEQLEGR